ncbi:MAG: hypothetical protein MJ153_07995 [Clostridia bacterium]|nr:hypothetical protein [Clostridia bacterium]
MPHSLGGFSGGHSGGGHHRYYGTDRLCKGDKLNFNLKAKAVITVVVVMVTVLCCVLINYCQPKKVTSDYTLRISIDDNADIFSESDEELLIDSMNQFYNATGIAPCVMVVRNEDWMGKYNSLEKYGYDKYLSKFDDEKHWLLVYSKGDKDDDWYFEGIQGNDTDSVLCKTTTYAFIKDLEENINSGLYSNITIPLQITLDEYSVKAMETHFDTINLVIWITVVFVEILFGAAWIFGDKLDLREKQNN